MSNTRPGATSILQSVELRGEADTRPSYFVYVVLPIVLLLATALIAALVVLVVVGLPVAVVDGDQAATEDWLEENLAVLGGLLLLFVAAAIAGAVLTIMGLYKVIKRRNEHLSRDQLLRQGSLELCRDAAQGDEGLNEQVEAMERIHNEAQLEENERSAALHLILAFLLGFWMYYVIYFLLKDIPRHSRRQRRFSKHVAQVLKAKGLGEPPEVPAVPERSFMLYLGLILIVPFALAAGGLVLGVVFLVPIGYLVGIGAQFTFFYWIFNDPHEHFDGQWAHEDELVSLVQQAAPAGGRSTPAQAAAGDRAADADEAGGAPEAAEGEAPAAPDKPAFTVWSCLECEKRYKVPPKRPVKVTCKNCGYQEILRE